MPPGGPVAPPAPSSGFEEPGFAEDAIDAAGEPDVMGGTSTYDDERRFEEEEEEQFVSYGEGEMVAAPADGE